MIEHNFNTDSVNITKLLSKSFEAFFKGPLTNQAIHNFILENDLPYHMIDKSNDGYGLGAEIPGLFCEVLGKTLQASDAINYIIGAGLYFLIYGIRPEVPCLPIEVSDREASIQIEYSQYQQNANLIVINPFESRLEVIFHHQIALTREMEHYDNKLVMQEIIANQTRQALTFSDKLKNYYSFKNYLLCRYVLGLVTRAFNLTVARLKTRRQFSKPLIEYQTIRHQLANLYSLIYSYEKYLYTISQLSDNNCSQKDAVTAINYAGYLAHTVFLVLTQLNGASGFTEINPYSQCYQLYLVLLDKFTGLRNRP